MSQDPKATFSWISLGGNFIESGNDITFKGYTYTPPPPDTKGGSHSAEPPQYPRPGVGRFISNQRLTDGRVSVDIEFDRIDSTTTAEVILHYDPITDEMLSVGLGASGWLINVRYFTSFIDDKMPQQTEAGSNQLRWNRLRSIGDRTTMKSGRSYNLQAKVQGSFVIIELDGVELGTGTIPIQLSGRQVGLFCQSETDIHFRNLRLDLVRPLAFIVMQFNPPEYEELFHDVIDPVCRKMNLEPFRSSQTYSPGLVISDIQRQIRESRVVIAEITPVNPNVYYEVGFADAIGKPVILVADGGKLDQLPFDVRAFRTLFYENTIGGKKKVETTLMEFLRHIIGSNI